jgi:hypothetical protein
MTFTTLPFLIAFMAGLLCMRPLDIYAINAWNHGTEQTDPWRSTRTTLSTVQRVTVIWTHVRDWCAELTAHPLLTQLITSEVGAVGNIKQLIQDEADNRKAIAAARAPITKLKKEGRQLNALEKPTPEQTTRFTALLKELDPLEASLEALEEKQEEIAAQLVIARRLQDDERKGLHADHIIIIPGEDHVEDQAATLGEVMQAMAYQAFRATGRSDRPRTFCPRASPRTSSPRSAGWSSCRPSRLAPPRAPRNRAACWSATNGIPRSSTG